MIILLNFNSNTKFENSVTCKTNSKQNEIRRNLTKQWKIRENKSRQNHGLITSGRINMLDWYQSQIWQVLNMCFVTQLVLNSTAVFKYDLCTFLFFSRDLVSFFIFAYEALVMPLFYPKNLICVMQHFKHVKVI